MTLPRRRFLHLAAGAAMLPAVSRDRARAILSDAAGAHRCWLYPRRRDRHPGPPDRPVAVGAARPDIHCREPAGRRQQYRHRSGRAGAADGHTLLLVAPANAINATLYDRLNFDFIRDIAPVAGLISVANVMEVNPSLPAKTLPEFIAYAKANPGKVNYASAGTGSQQHVAGELFKMMAGIEMVHVPYRGGGPALADLMGGQVQLFFGTTASTIELIRSGKLRALAVTTAERSQALPDVPTVAEFVPGYEASSWYGIGAPKNTPPEIIATLNKEINAGLADPKIKARLADMGGTALTGPAAEFGKLIADETEKWAKVVKVSGAKAGAD